MCDNLYHCTASVQNMFDCRLLQCSVVGNHSANSCELGMWSIIVCSWTLCIKYVITDFCGNCSAIKFYNVVNYCVVDKDVCSSEPA